MQQLPKGTNRLQGKTDGAALQGIPGEGIDPARVRLDATQQRGAVIWPMHAAGLVLVGGARFGMQLVDAGSADAEAGALAAMASGWQQQDIERCLIQARYKNRGFTNDEEISWLHIPQKWWDAVQMEEPHSPTEIIDIYNDRSACLSDIGMASCRSKEGLGSAAANGECLLAQ